MYFYLFSFIRDLREREKVNTWELMAELKLRMDEKCNHKNKKNQSLHQQHQHVHHIRIQTNDSSEKIHHHHRSSTSILNNLTPKQIEVGACASIACETCWYVTLALILISFKIKIDQLTYHKW
ncbi:hypothetical protein CROQUDRAFT_659319 [Cronartium quercuum f. sp. fusiforme G11]|uniref:Uncharacterized protein n=1 Tax=Cronartium quercuum f. sp. fusiforme G11 TaxID=708437 RepID=A0A9P6NDS9_9BASI|nr:hypothetical protein CROQUDRAFT_659319 [Cronartium quercuum f. sp. fusiforme G11]